MRELNGVASGVEKNGVEKNGVIVAKKKTDNGNGKLL